MSDYKPERPGIGEVLIILAMAIGWIAFCVLVGTGVIQ